MVQWPRVGKHSNSYCFPSKEITIKKIYFTYLVAKFGVLYVKWKIYVQVSFETIRWLLGYPTLDLSNSVTIQLSKRKYHLTLWLFVPTCHMALSRFMQYSVVIFLDFRRCMFNFQPVSECVWSLERLCVFHLSVLLERVQS